MRLSKLHGLGNDFLVLLDDGSAAAGPGAAKSLCDRRTGVGADGLIRSARTERGVTFELWNADGSVAEVSGNGIRCLALAARRAGWWDHTDEPLSVATAAGPRTVLWVDGGDDACTCSVDMGIVAARPERPSDAGVDAPAAVVALDVGNPHVVVLLHGHDLPAPRALDGAVAGIERTFPAGVNVEYVVRGPGTDEVTMIVHERGAGWTQACGTGSCAVAHAARTAGWSGDRLVVHNPGGAVTVDLAGDVARLTGPAVWIADVLVGEVAP